MRPPRGSTGELRRRRGGALPGGALAGDPVVERGARGVGKPGQRAQEAVAGEVDGFGRDGGRPVLLLGRAPGGVEAGVWVLGRSGRGR